MARAIGINHVALEVGDIDEAPAWYSRFGEFELRGQRPSMATRPRRATRQAAHRTRHARRA